jgi:CDP-glucose 4,6-dehydratase
MPIEKSRILVTGATGLVGSALVKRLLEKKPDKLVCLVRDFVPNSPFFLDGLDKRVTIARGDLTDFFAVERVINEYEIESIVHLGAQAIVPIANCSPLSTFESNIKGTWNVLEAARLHDKKVKSIVVASSDKAYGEQKVLPYTEDMPLQGSHPYDVSKSCADLLATAYAKTYGLNTVISRCGNFYGPGDLNFNRIVPGTILSALRGERPIIRSDGKMTRDYIYVMDAAEAYITLVEKSAELKISGEAFNFSTESQLTVLELVGKILKACGRSDLKPVIKNEPVKEIPHQHLSAAKARKVLGWKSKYGLEEGLKETVKWYAAYFKEEKKK